MIYRYEKEGPRIEVLQTWAAGRKVFDADTSDPHFPPRLAGVRMQAKRVDMQE